jgi:hypothetical protein
MDDSQALRQTDEQYKTSVVFERFDCFSDEALDSMLEAAGLRPCQNRCLKLQQALCVWFHGDIPSLNTFVKLVNQLY